VVPKTMWSRRRGPGGAWFVAGVRCELGVQEADARWAVELCPARRGGTPDEVGTVGALLMGPDGGFITGSDFIMDGGLTAAYRFGELAP
jgi:NAD(P)-dependent dehydrogenase (short-subunit alcohol dehydrogenase family)